MIEIGEFSSTIPIKLQNNLPTAIRMKLIYQQLFTVLAECCADTLHLAL